MLFASASLARRIEHAERRLIVDMALAVQRTHKDAEVQVVPLGGAAAVFAGTGSPLNKLVGAGFDGTLDEGALAEVERAFTRRGVALQAELSSLGDPRLAGELARRGYVLTGFENVLGMALHESVAARAESAATSIEIRTSNTVDERTWIDVVVAGFAHPDEFDGPASHESFSNESLQRVMTAVARTEGLQRYLALRDDRPAGGASLRLCDGIALLCGSATLPEHRRRGVQTALVQRRLADAARAGCDVAVVTTQPGSKSQENAQRRGFELLYTRAILVRAPG